MTGNTHKAGGMLISIIGFAMLKQNNMLAPDINIGLQWLLMYPFCMWGSVASDLDHNPNAIPMKDYPSKIVSGALHITEPLEKATEVSGGAIHKVARFFNAKHRSWQTHSDLTLVTMLFILYKLLSIESLFTLGPMDLTIIRLVLTGICLGVIAHFILDMLTPEGIWLTGFAVLNRLIKKKVFPEKMHFVPHKKFFATGGKWELFIQKVLRVATWVALAWFLYTFLVPYLANYIPYDITIDK